MAGKTDSNYGTMLKRASAKYKRDILLDFILNLGYMPSAKIELIKDSIKKALSRIILTITNQTSRHMQEWQ